ncbi:MAG TPA: hypothetical protein VKE74_31225, partial [Gemmataceae bacterium]|nr:hypothetical protein [Gemmataceae bacterium]
ILTGRPPFRGGSAVEILHQVVNDEPVPPSRVAPRSNRDLGLVAMKCLARDPGARYQSASDVADELDRWLRGEPLLVRPLGLPTLALRWLRKNVGAALAVVGIGSVWGLSVGVSLLAFETRRGRTMLTTRDGSGISLIHPYGWVELVTAFPVVRDILLVLAVGLTPIIGWVIRAGTKPKQAKAAVGYGFAVGFIAAFIGLSFFAPITMVVKQRQIHPLKQNHLFGEQSGTGSRIIPPEDRAYLTPFLPPEGSSPFDQEHQYLHAHDGAVIANRVYTASWGVMVATVMSLILFIGLGCSSTWVADQLSRSGHGFMARSWRYLVIVSSQWLAFYLALLVALEVLSPNGGPGNEFNSPSWGLLPLGIILVGFLILATHVPLLRARADGYVGRGMSVPAEPATVLGVKPR